MDYEKIVREIVKIIMTVEFPEDVQDEIIQLFIRAGIFENGEVKDV